MLSEKSLTLLNSFVAGELDFEALWDDLAASEYDEMLPLRERDTLASIRLLAIEVDEGLRTPDELQQGIESLLRIESTMSCEFTVQTVVTGAENSTFTLTEKLGSFASRISDVRIQPAGAS